MPKSKSIDNYIKKNNLKIQDNIDKKQYTFDYNPKFKEFTSKSISSSQAISLKNKVLKSSWFKQFLKSFGFVIMNDINKLVDFRDSDICFGIKKNDSKFNKDIYRINFERKQVYNRQPSTQGKGWTPIQKFSKDGLKLNLDTEEEVKNFF